NLECFIYARRTRMGPNVVQEPFVRPGPNRSNGVVSGSWRGSCTYLQQIRQIMVQEGKHITARPLSRQALRNLSPGAEGFLSFQRRLGISPSYAAATGSTAARTNIWTTHCCQLWRASGVFP